MTLDRGGLEEMVRDRFGSGTRVCAVTELAGDASTRRYARLWLTGAGAPPSAVAMLLADRGVALSSEELAVFAAAPTEMPFINVHRYLSAIGVAVPEVYVDATARGVVLLEDVGDTALWDAVQQETASGIRQLYERAIDQLLRIQVEGARHPDPACLAFQQCFDERLFLWEFEHFIEFGIERRLGRALPSGDADVLRRHFRDIAAHLGNVPRYLTHRDFHSWNLFIQAGAIRVIDFQDALLAPAAYDLATLLGDRDTPQVVGPGLEMELLQYYREGRRERSGHEFDSVQFEREYFLCALQKALKVVGRFYYLDMEKKKPGYLRYIPSTVRQILRVLPRFPELSEMAEVVCRYLPAPQPCAP